MPMPRTKTWLASGAALLATLLMPEQPTARADEATVDLALILAIDCSYSVDAKEFRTQMKGMGQAFMQPDVKAAIAAGEHGKIAVAVIEWSDMVHQAVVIPWTVVGSADDADALGDRMVATERSLAEGGTSISRSLAFAAKLMASAPPATRRTIDMSADGPNNNGPSVKPVRDAIVASGVVINGLPILSEWETLDIYFENEVVGGPNHFVMPAEGYSTYDKAIYRKLLREIAGPGVS